MAPSPAVGKNPVIPHSKRPIVDLTEDKDDLRRAIEMSLAEGSSTVSTATSPRPAGVSQEDQDVSKALEASLLESVNSRSSLDGQNPNDRKREEDVSIQVQICLQLDHFLARNVRRNLNSKRHYLFLFPFWTCRT